MDLELAMNLHRYKRVTLGGDMKKLYIFIFTMGLATTTHAFGDKDGTTGALQSALQESNRDYNQHKKQFLNEENARIDNWNAQKVRAIEIGEGEAIGGAGPVENEINSEDVSMSKMEDIEIESFQDISMELTMNDI